MQEHSRTLPRHVAIIMDGNGRWAAARHMPRSYGHRAGVARVREIVKACSRLGIEALTLYTFSTENWKRPKDEVTLLMRLLIEYMSSEMAELHMQNVRFQVIGGRDRFSKELEDTITRSEALTKNNTGLLLTIAVDYGSRAELTEAARKLAVKYKTGELQQIDEGAFAAELMTAGMPDPDFVIRTSGEMRISNFLLWQIAYSEFYFTDVNWPDFDEREFLRALDVFSGRTRRFGAL